MRFMMIVKASKDSEAGIMPSMELIQAMGKFKLAAEGLVASSKGARVRFEPGKKPAAIDGPFAETKELIAGYWMIQVNSKKQAVSWALRNPAPHGPDQATDIEIRKVFEASDFGPEGAPNEQALRNELSKRTKNG